jgi:WD40 repeat protein
MVLFMALVGWLTAADDQILQAHSEAITDLRFSPDGKWIATSSMDLTVKIWDAGTGKVVHVLADGDQNPDNGAVGRQYYPRGIRFFPDSRRLASFGHSGKVWDIQEPRKLADLTTWHTASCLAISPDGSVIARGGWRLGLWDGKSLTLRGELEAEKCPSIEEVQFSADSKLLLSRGWKNNDLVNRAHLLVWSVEAGLPILNLGKGRYSVTHAALSRDGTRVAAAFRNQNDTATLKVWEIPSAVVKLEADFSDYTLDDLVLSPDSRTLVTRTWGGVVRLWDLKEGKERDVGLAPLPYAVSFVFSPDGKSLAVGESRPVGQKEVPFLSIRDPITGRELAIRRIGKTSVTESWSCLKGITAAFSPDGRKVAVVLGKGEFALLDFEKVLLAK